jgi:exopolyphosphatase/guanosine-5'-triphosphate,3'-diphosphate pyrophosphatase
VLKSMREPIRLAAGLDAKGNLTEAAMDSALACLNNFREALATYKLDAVRVVATSTMRVAHNSATFLPAAEHALGYPIEIISGEEEGRLIYMGVANALGNHAERRLVMDIGGGSTELILGQGLDIERVESFSDRHRQAKPVVFRGRAHRRRLLRGGGAVGAQPFRGRRAALPPEHWKQAYGSSGTIRAIGEIIARSDLGDGKVTAAGLDALKRRFIEFGHVNRIDMPGLRPDRASTIIGGLAILIALVAELAIDELIPVEAGLRMGVMWDLYLRSMQRDRRDESVRALARKFHVDEARAPRRRRRGAPVRPAQAGRRGLTSCCHGARCCTRWGWWCRRPATTSTPPT